MTKFWLTILIIITINSCVHEYPFKQRNPDSSTIIVEGYITNQFNSHPIYLTRLSSYTDTIRNVIKKAFVAVTSGDSTYYYRETQPGKYESIINYVGLADNVYFLHVEINDTILSAESTMLPVTPPEKITFNHYDDGLMSINTVAQSFVNENPAKYVLTLNWHNDNNRDTTAKLYYYSLTTVDISQLFAPQMKETKFPQGTQIIEHKYSIDKDYEIYLRSMLAETIWSGGYFDEAHGNLHTNITCNKPNVKTAGYFSANTIYIDTIIAK